MSAPDDSAANAAEQRDGKGSPAGRSVLERGLGRDLNIAVIAALLSIVVAFPTSLITSRVDEGNERRKERREREREAIMNLQGALLREIEAVVKVVVEGLPTTQLVVLGADAPNNEVRPGAIAATVRDSPPQKSAGGSEEPSTAAAGGVQPDRAAAGSEGPPTAAAGGVQPDRAAAASRQVALAMIDYESARRECEAARGMVVNTEIREASKTVSDLGATIVGSSSLQDAQGYDFQFSAARKIAIDLINEALGKL